MKKRYTLIVPMVTVIRDNSDMPVQFKYNNKTGQINCIRCIEGLDLSQFDKIYFILLYEHEQKYHIAEKISIARKYNPELLNIEFIFTFLDYPTTSQAETVYNEIKKYDIKGPIFIKDADNTCTYKDFIDGNSVFVYPLEKTMVVDPQHKSYVSTDDQNFIVNIIEKRVINNLFNCGGYKFDRASDFIEAYEGMLGYEMPGTHMYISHLIYWLILYKKIKFRPINVENFIDFKIEQITNE